MIVFILMLSALLRLAIDSIELLYFHSFLNLGSP
jgi:hypothetical protein